MHFFQTSAGLCVKEQTKRKRNRVKKAKEAQKQSPATPEEFLLFRDNEKAPLAIRSPTAFVSNIPPPQREKMSASPASYNVTLATLRTTSPSRNKTRKQVRQQTEKEKRRARLLKKLEIVALRERGFAAHNVRFFKPLHYPLFLI